jgi:hypothetical protein
VVLESIDFRMSLTELYRGTAALLRDMAANHGGRAKRIAIYFTPGWAARRRGLPGLAAIDCVRFLYRRRLRRDDEHDYAR